MAKKKLKAPKDRNFGAEMEQIGKYAAESAKAQAEAAGKLNQQYIDQALAATDTIAGKLNNGYTAAGRAGLDGAMRQVPRMDALAGRLESLGATAEADVAGTDIEAELRKQALADLQLGRQLSPEQERAAQMAARQGFAARGMAVGPASAAAEILNRDAYATMREDARRAFAGSVNQAETSNRIARLGAAGGLLGQAAGVRQNTASLGLQGAQGYVALDPYQRALGSNIPIASQGASASMTGNAFNGILGYGQDLANTNFNAQWSNYLNKQNMQTANQMGQMQMGAAKSAGDSSLMGAGIGAAGAAIGGAALAICWVARAAWGEGSDRWVEFRKNMLRRAPDWWLRAYCRHGERVASVVRGAAARLAARCVLRAAEVAWGR